MPKTHSETAKDAAAFGRRCFPWRIVVGLAALPFGVLAVKPRNHFGEFAPHAFVVSLVLVLAGLGLRAWAAAIAGDHTRSSRIEAPRLVTGGPFAHVRNPIYLGSFILGFGMVGLLGDLWLLLPHFAVFTIFFGAIVPAEENFLQRQFGDEYTHYRCGVPKLIPALRPWGGRTVGTPCWRQARGEALIALLLLAIYTAFRAVLFLKG